MLTKADRRDEHAATVSPRIVPLGAGVSAVSTLLSCLPLSFASAIGAATLSTALRPLRSWLIGLSVILLTVGFAQLYRQPRARRSLSTTVTLWISVIFVLLVVLSVLHVLPPL
jgi:hypothetical protein